MNKKTSIVFFGSGPVAAKSLAKLVNKFDVEAVITKPSTEQELSSACPDTPLYTVTDKSDLDNLMNDKAFKSSVGVLIDFGIIITNKVIDYFKYGIVNSHFSLLPELRGADPISFAILEGKVETGVSLMLLVEAMDEGPVIAQESLVIKDNHNTPSLTDDLINLSDDLIKKHLHDYLDSETKALDQTIWQKNNGKNISYTRKLTKADGIINWGDSANKIEREIRAFTGWPKSRTQLGEIQVAITDAEIHAKNGDPGELFIIGKKLGVYCGEDSLIINKLVPAGKKSMTSDAFLLGYKKRIGL